MTSEEGSEAPERECAGAEQRQRQAQDVSQVNKELVAELERRAEGRTAELESTLAQARAAESQRLAAEEELREAHLDIVRAREDAEVRHNEAESLLEGLRSLTEALDVERVFAGMLDVLRGLLAFEHAFILTSHTTNELKAIHATDPIFESSVWQTKRYFQRVLAGKTLAAFDTTQIPEWQAQSPRLHTQAVSALHIPLRTGEEWAMLVCTHTARGFFVKEHVLLAQRFSVLAAHALRNAELHAALKAERDTLEARVRERTEEIRSLAKFPEENPYPILRVAAGGKNPYSHPAGVDLLGSFGCDTDGNGPEPLHPHIRPGLPSGEPGEAGSPSGERGFSCTLSPGVAAG
ncbi:MAG: GAF domain-containing protein, partial [Ardenticatenia bacterium]|nr:GAF domain-containing protein [Ardenticatenia bacterium]